MMFSRLLVLASLPLAVVCVATELKDFAAIHERASANRSRLSFGRISRDRASLLGTFTILRKASASGNSAPKGRYNRVHCSEIPIPGLATPWGDAYTCKPVSSSGRLFPLMVFGHGDLSWPSMYAGLIKQMASFGFVVTAYNSCYFTLSWSWTQCHGGKASFLEMLKIINHFVKNPKVERWKAPVNMSKPVIVSGHSTGARAALMMAALKDAPSYLSGTKECDYLSRHPELRAAVSYVGAAIAFNPDRMYHKKYNPDVDGYRVTETPTFILTRSADYISKETSAWRNFAMLETPTKIYADILGSFLVGGHLGPIFEYVCGPYAALFGLAFANGDQAARELVYGDGPKSLRKVVNYAKPGDRNTGAAAASQW
eukprot:TRINITY_DN2606_c0_g1_i4.p1 TRINITY_DN2606_c0_g1~~TRINITY_DN2606_c0_g1_i4.p1  ORF type:complete len:384 (-),score=54.38 TRINITY_DN2606_c0_g1_i4:211-1323(-)